MAVVASLRLPAASAVAAVDLQVRLRLQGSASDLQSHLFNKHNNNTQL